ncbi:hypothetical protein EV122DRAFT_256887, partial [Schizophyllum commune]
MVDFAQRSCEKLITNLGLWKKYFRRYVRRSGALVNSGKITTDDEAYYFWMGIHPDLRAVLESKIQLRRQMRRESESSEESDSEDDEEVYSVREICSAAHHQFRRNRFVTRRFDADRFGQRPGEESSGSETDSDANDTSDDSGAEKLKKKLRLEKKRKEHRKEKKKEKRQLERTSKMTGSPADLTQIVQKLNSMKPDIRVRSAQSQKVQASLFEESSEDEAYEYATSEEYWSDSPYPYGAQVFNRTYPAKERLEKA